MRSAQQLAVVFVVAVLAQGCGDGGSGGEGGGDGGGNNNGSTTSGVDPGCGTLAEQFTEPTCGECAEEGCCDELLACDSGTDCGELLDCIGECDTDACVVDCEASVSAGVAARDAFDGCLAASCSEPCNVVTEGLCGSDFTTTDVECDGCIGRSCCTPLTACIDDAACSLCLEDASGVGCEEDLLLQDVLGCFETSCPGICDG